MANLYGIDELADGIVMFNFMSAKPKRYKWRHRHNVDTGSKWFQFYVHTANGWRFLNNQTHHKVIARIKERAGIK